MKFLNKLSRDNSTQYLNVITPESRFNNDESNSAVVDEVSGIENQFLDPDEIKAETLAETAKANSAEARASLLFGGDSDNLEEGEEAAASSKKSKNKSVVSSALESMEPDDSDKMNEEVKYIDRAASSEVQTAQISRDAFNKQVNAEVDAIVPTATTEGGAAQLGTQTEASETSSQMS